MRNESAWNPTRYPYIERLRALLSEKASYLTSSLYSQHEAFDASWLEQFELELSKFYGLNPDALDRAVSGYTRFALEGMLLQKKFDKIGEYAAKTYAEAASEVYQNRNYMFELYLPGIHLSHFLWKHHYLQHIFFLEEFLPLLRKHGGNRFFDVGVGTGFYSKEMLLRNPGFSGQGFDMSAFSLEHTTTLLRRWGLDQRYSTNLGDVTTITKKPRAPFLVNIEVLEHLEDPVTFLKSLHEMLEPGGYGLISAAITAPNADHIYLYRNMGEVNAHLEQAGFEIVKYREDKAYEPTKPGMTSPINGVAIVTRN